MCIDVGGENRGEDFYLYDNDKARGTNIFVHLLSSAMRYMSSKTTRIML